MVSRGFPIQILSDILGGGHCCFMDPEFDPGGWVGGEHRVREVVLPLGPLLHQRAGCMGCQFPLGTDCSQALSISEAGRHNVKFMRCLEQRCLNTRNDKNSQEPSCPKELECTKIPDQSPIRWAVGLWDGGGKAIYQAQEGSLAAGV